MQPEIARTTTPHGLEHTCTFGSDARLNGVYTPPVCGDVILPCALFLTAGLLHHVGPHRFYVEMARDLAEVGAASLRFDLAGVGDSETRSSGSSYAQRSVEDVRSAMNHLQREYGHSQFVLIGLCSGADDALATAQQDSRVAGAVMLNGYAYRAGQFHWYRAWNFFVPRLFMWQKWQNRYNKLMGRAPTDAYAAASNSLDDDYRYIPPQTETADNINSLTRQGTQLLFIYTGSEHEDYTYKGQFFDMFPDARDNLRVREAYLKEADHTLVLKSDRNTLSNWIRSWYAGVPFERKH
ncbi:MAG: alpha/beta fold hydrolase [Pseudomonadota bacterium]